VRTCPHMAAGLGAGFLPGVGAWFALPFVSILRAGLALLWIFALVSAARNRNGVRRSPPGRAPGLGGRALPVSCFIFSWHGRSRPCAAHITGTPRAGHSARRPLPMRLTPWWEIAFVAVLLWLGLHHLPQIHEAIRNIPPLFHEAVEAVKSWWAQK